MPASPQTTLQASNSPIPKTCRECGNDFEIPPELGYLARLTNVCDPCSIRYIEQDRHLQIQQAENARKDRWNSICPEGLRDTVVSRLPRVDLWQQAMQWEYGPAGLLLHGPSGKGKSRTLYMLAHREFKAGRKVLSINHGSAYDYAAKFSESARDAARWIDELSEVALLVMDDPFKSKLTDSYEQSLFTVIASRTERRVPILVSLNDTGASLLERLSVDRGAAMLRRLREMTTAIAFV